MEQINAIQGTPEWHAHRDKCWNASMLPIITGDSGYQSRDALMFEIKTGIKSEFSSFVQDVIFAKGHLYEALARPLAANIVGKKLYPVVGYTDEFCFTRPLSASFDGLDMSEVDGFEHKSMNEELRQIFAMDAPLLRIHTIQMEGQLMVSMGTRILFMATKWDGDILIEERHRWYESDPELRKEIIASVRQFEKDLEAYVPAIISERPQAEAVLALPSLFVHARGEVTQNNMEEFGKALADSLASARCNLLLTDQDFSNAKAAAKDYRETCKKLVAAKESMLANTLTIGDAARMMDLWHEDLRKTALDLEKKVEKKEAELRIGLVNEAKLSYAEHYAALEAQIKPIRLNIASPDFAGAMKGKSKISSLTEAVNTALAGAKIDADMLASELKLKLHYCQVNSEGFQFLFSDLQQIIGKPQDDFELLVRTRIAEHSRAEEVRMAVETTRIEEAARIKAETEAQATIEAETARIRSEEQAKARAKAEEADKLESERARIQAEEAKARAEDESTAVISNQDDISTFLKSRDFGKDEGKIRAVLVEFVKFQATTNKGSTK